MRLRENLFRDPGELSQLSGSVYGKAMYLDATQGVCAGRIYVGPESVVLSTRSEDVNLSIAGQVLGHPATVKFCSTIDIRAVALNDEGNAQSVFSHS